MRNSQRPTGRIFDLESTVENGFAALPYYGVDRNLAVKPGMPWVPKNSILRNVGLVLLGCTIESDDMGQPGG